MATKTVKQKTEKFTFDKAFKNVKNTAADVNDFAIETTEDLLKEVVGRSEQWQTVANKAIDGGLKLAATQQDIVWDTLESIKGQLNHGRKRFKALFSKN